LVAGDPDIGGEDRAHGADRDVIRVDVVVETVVKKPDSMRAARNMVCWARAICSRAKHFLALTGWLDGDGVLLETGDLVMVFEPDHGEAGCGEA